MNRYSEVISLINDSASMTCNSKIRQLSNDNSDIINMTIGEPYFNLDERIKEFFKLALKENQTHYVEKQGVFRFRKAILEWNNVENRYSEKNIIVTSGAKYAIYLVMKTILNRNDEVIILKPYWVSYPDIVKICYGIPKIVECKNNFQIDFEELQKTLTKNTKAIILNNPNNPSGNIYTKEEISRIKDFCKDNDLFLVADEIYSEISFDEYHSLLEQEKSENVIVVNGVSKSLACTGLRIGYLFAEEDLVNNILKLHQHIMTCSGSLEQYALSHVNKDLYHQITTKYREKYLEKRNYLINSLKDNIPFFRPKGAFYMLLNIKNRYEDSLSAFRSLLYEYNIGVVPGIAYGVDDYVRISYSLPNNLLEVFVNRIKKAFS